MREPGFHFANPSELLLEEDPKPRGVEQLEAARQLGVLLKHLNEIVFGKRGIAADTALRLGRSQRTPPQLWMRLQADWGLHQAMQRARRKASLPRLAVPVLYPILRFLVDLAVSGGFDSA
jgi:addiction module HigA family antidote